MCHYTTGPGSERVTVTRNSEEGLRSGAYSAVNYIPWPHSSQSHRTHCAPVSHKPNYVISQCDLIHSAHQSVTNLTNYMISQPCDLIHSAHQSVTNLTNYVISQPCDLIHSAHQSVKNLTNYLISQPPVRPVSYCAC